MGEKQEELGISSELGVDSVYEGSEVKLKWSGQGDLYGQKSHFIQIWMSVVLLFFLLSFCCFILVALRSDFLIQQQLNVLWMYKVNQSAANNLNEC